ncbi:hypothetical protein [Allohahella marinimesophila]|uniref:Glycosyltransferase RgtA/B/C/D-like domain-containing protein n=1 Tax=Allohahella marinimesophila TaxID=1054972 RepID=A0ABP7PMQ4_9GAMM
MRTMRAKQSLTILLNRSIEHPYVTTFVLCLLGALIKILLVSYPLSSDGALYLTVARVFSQEGFDAALALYYYPFLSILISLVSDVTGMSLLHAGQLVCVGLATLTSLSFVYIVRQHDRGWATTLAAILLIVLLPQLNELKEQVYRDFGLWAFTLAALASLIHFERGATRWFFLLWFVLQCLAGLFKQEGFVPLLAPFVLAFTGGSRTRVFRSPLVLMSGLIIGAVVGLLYYLNRHDLHWALQYTDRLGSIPEHITSQAAILGETVLNQYSDRHATGLYLWMLAVLLLLSLIKAFKTAVIIPVLYLLSMAWRNSSIAPALKAYIVLVALPVIMFCIEYQFVAARYMMLLVLLILAAVLPGLIQQWSRFPKTARVIAILLGLSLTVESFSVSVFNDGHLKSAERWLEENTAPEARVFSNARAITFVLDRLDEPRDAMRNRPKSAEDRYDYYLHLSSRKHPSAPPFETGPALATFTAEKGKQADIFYLGTPADREPVQPEAQGH